MFNKTGVCTSAYKLYSLTILKSLMRNQMWAMLVLKPFQYFGQTNRDLMPNSAPKRSSMEKPSNNMTTLPPRGPLFSLLRSSVSKIIIREYVICFQILFTVVTWKFIALVDSKEKSILLLKTTFVSYKNLQELIFKQKPCLWYVFCRHR